MEPLRKTDPKRIGPYALVARLGAGGMGTVYLATRGESTVALKVVSGGFEDDPALQSRFVREIENLKKMRSPFIAGILDSKAQKDSAWLAVHYVNGPHILQEVSRNGPLDDKRLWELTIGCLIALAQIHSLGVVHRDIKPANILLSETGPKLIDFGISQKSDDTSLTTTGLVAGSPAWLAPEQLDVGEVTGAADLFSLGSLLVFAASGRSPWGNQNTMSVPILFNKILSESPDLSSLGSDLRQIVSPALAKDPRQRPEAKDMLSQAVQAAPVDVLRRIKNWLELASAQVSRGRKPDSVISQVIRELDQRLVDGQQVAQSNQAHKPSDRLGGSEPRAMPTELVENRKSFGLAAMGIAVVASLAAGALLVSTVLPTIGDTRGSDQDESPQNLEVPPEAVEPPNYIFTTVSDSGIATLTPGDGSEVFSEEEFMIELAFAESVTSLDNPGPEVTIVSINRENFENPCLGTRVMEASPDDSTRFGFRCDGLPEGSYLIRAIWGLSGTPDADESFTRETTTALVEVRNRPPAENVSDATVAGPSAALRYEFLGGGWGAWDDAQYFSLSGNALVRSWCLRSSPGWAWRDDNNWAEILNPDGSVAERVAGTQNRGACTITGSVNGMEDGDPGELRVITVPSSAMLSRVVPGECLIVRFTAGGSSSAPEFNDVCIRG